MTLVVKLEDQVVPDSYIKEVLDNNPGIMGVAVSAKGNEVQFGRSDFAPMEQVTKLIGTGTEHPIKDKDGKDVLDVDGKPIIWKNHTILAWFSETKPSLKIDYQPFTLLRNERDKPCVMVFLDGDFSSFIQGESSHDPAYYVVEGHLKPMILKMHRMLKTVEAVEEYIHSDDFKKEEMDTLLSRAEDATITFIFSSGTTKSFYNLENVPEFSWGYTTNAYNYKDQLPLKLEGEYPEGATAGAEGEEEGTLGSLLGNVVSAVKPIVDKAMGKEPGAAPTGTGQQTTSTQIYSFDPLNLPPGVTLEQGKLFFQAPKSIKEHKEVKAWYMKIRGSVPQGYKARPKVAGLEKYAVDLAHAGKEATKDTTVQNIPTSSGPSSAIPPTTTKLPSAHGFIPADMKQRVQDIFCKRPTVEQTLDHSGKPIVDPTKYPSLEHKVMKASEAMAMANIRGVFGWMWPEWEELAKPEFAQFTTNLMVEMRNAWLEDYLELQKLKPKEVVSEPVKPAAVAAKKRAF